MVKQRMGKPKFGSNVRLVISCFIALLLLPLAVRAVEIKWTPAPDQETTNYSMQDRQKLLQLDQQISSSSNPQDALQKVASTNGIDPHQLAETLMENRKFFEQNGAALVQNQRQPLTVTLAKAMTSIFVGLWQISLKHPRSSSVLLVILCMNLWVAWNAPRNGVVLEGGSGAGRGLTTLFVPSSDFLEATVLERDWWKIDPLLESYHLPVETRNVWMQLDGTRKPNKTTKKDSNKNADVSSTYNQVFWYSDFSKSQDSDALLKVAYIEQKVELQVQLTDEDEADKLLLYKLVHDQAQRLLNDLGRLTEFVLDHKIRLITSQSDTNPDFSVLMVPRLGKWGAIGYIPFEMQNDLKLAVGDGDVPPNQSVLASVALPILPGTYWGGQGIFIRILEQRTESSKKGTAYIVQVAWVVKDNDGKKRSRIKLLPNNLVDRILQSVCASLNMSLETRTQQAWTRRAQSARLSNKAKLAAAERRQTRSSRERQIEEMAADRRRRRYSQNPNQGRYRPSGDRMRSPNNAIYK